MIVVPLGREEAVLQRHAWVTYVLIALNVAAFFLFCIGATDEQRITLMRSWHETISYLRDRPYLTVPWQAADLMPREIRQRPQSAALPVTDWQAAKEQKIANEMGAELRQLYDSVDDIRLAYVPAVGSISTIFTSMFLHAGLWHLLGNMFFLFATAPFVEDVFGRLLFSILYLTGGVLATLGFAWRYPNSVIPLVGASGAIAAVMGAYLVRFALSRLRFLLVPIVFLPFWNFRFSLPALVVLPLWFLEQVVSIPAEGDSGVAVTAHVAGFAYGLLFAGIIRVAGIERRFIKPAIDKEIASIADPRLERGVAAFHRGDLQTANREVKALLAERPKDIDALRLALDLALKTRDPKTIDPLAVRLLDRYAAANERELATDLIAELRGTESLRRFLDRAAMLLERWGDRDQAMVLLERLAKTEGETALPAMVKLAMMRRSAGDTAGARATLERALAQPQCSPEWKRRIENTLTQL